VVVLGLFFVINLIMQANWITFAPITGDAATFYGVSELSIAVLSMIFMIVYLAVSIPASYVIDTYGIRIGIGIGAGAHRRLRPLERLFRLQLRHGLCRAVWPCNRPAVLSSTP